MTSPLQVIYDIFPGFVLLIDKEGVILDYKADKKLPLHFDAPSGRSIQEFLPFAIEEKLFDAIRETVKKGESTAFDFHWQLNNKKLWLEIRFSLIDDEHLIAVIQDITSQKRTEAYIQRQSRWLSALRAIDEAIAAGVELPLILSMLLFHITVQLGVDAANVLKRESDGIGLKSIAGIGFRSASFADYGTQIGVGYAGKAALEGRMVYVSDLSVQDSGFPQNLNLLQDRFAAYYAIPLIVKGKVEGVLEVFHRSVLQLGIDDLNLLEIFAKQAAIAMDHANLSENLTRSNADVEQAHDATIRGWARALSLRDKETEEHTCRVTSLALSLARMMNIPREKLIHVQRGAILHDIGKLGIPDDILLKPDSLTDEEWEIMRRHPQYALQILAPINYLKPALDIPYYHHEKWDGSGYPHGLKATQIPIAARIFAVADVYDALTSDRPYRGAWTRAEAREYIRSNAGTHFDPDVVACFTRLVREEPIDTAETLLKCNWKLQ